MRSAADKIALARRLRLQRDPSRVLISIDVRNAFNTMCRRRILRNLKNHPELHFLLPTYLAFYREAPQLRYRMANGTWRTIMSQEGVQQGDGLAGLF